MSTLRKYVRENVFGRFGQAVSRLVASDLIPRHEMPTSESEVHEWWLVSPDLAAKLHAARPSSSGTTSCTRPTGSAASRP